MLTFTLVNMTVVAGSVLWNKYQQKMRGQQADIATQTSTASTQEPDQHPALHVDVRRSQLLFYMLTFTLVNMTVAFGGEAGSVLWNKYQQKMRGQQADIATQTSTASTQEPVVLDARSERLITHISPAAYAMICWRPTSQQGRPRRRAAGF
jgi:uncharacterized membrane protein YebE (DUF533 family)